MASHFPNETPYNFASNNPIRLIDANGEAASDPPFWILFRETFMYSNRMMTNGAFQRAAEANGVESTAPYLPRLGRVFEDAVLRSANKVGMKKDIYPYPLTSPNTYFTPDAIENHRHTITDGSSGTYVTTKYDFEDAIITDAKFTTENSVVLTDQLRGFMDYLADKRGVSINDAPTGQKNSDYGMATMILATPSNVSISSKVIDYAKKKNVNLYQQVAIQVTDPKLSLGSDYSENSAIQYNKMKISEPYPIYIANSNVANFDRSEVTDAGGHGNGQSVNIDWRKR